MTGARVVGAGGALTGYAGGIERKRDLLTPEGGWRFVDVCPLWTIIAVTVILFRREVTYASALNFAIWC